MTNENIVAGIQPTDNVPVYWKGPEYGKNPLALRILILGESHTDHVEEIDKQATTTVIRNRIDLREHGNFFSVVEKIILGRKPAVFEISRLWNNLAFANYAPLQVVRGNRIKQRHFEGARKRFAEMVGELEPDLVCFFSKKAWWNRPVPKEASWQQAFSLDPVNLNDHMTMYPYRDRRTLAVQFNHPRGLKTPVSKWHDRFATALVEATRMKFEAVAQDPLIDR